MGYRPSSREETKLLLKKGIRSAMITANPYTTQLLLPEIDYNLRTQVLDQFEKLLPVVLIKENTERGCYISDVSYLIINSVQHTRNRDE